jgi:hypothetical protein
VVVALDTSGSVAAAGLRQGRALALDTLAHLPSGSLVAVFTFDDECRLVLAASSSGHEVRRAIERAQVSGRRTVLYDALYDASRYLEGLYASRKAIVLVTDGKDAGSTLVLDDSLAVAMGSGIPVYPVGVGSVNGRVLRRIAKLTGGEYRPWPTARGRHIAGRITASPAGLDGEKAKVRTMVPAPAPRAATAPSLPLAGPSTGATPTTLALSSVVLGAGLAFAIVRRRRARRRCPACGAVRALATIGCPSCARGERPVDADLSPAVLARLVATEEYVEKTVTLRPRPVLVALDGPDRGRTFDLSLQETTSLGRARLNDIVLADTAVSAEHCRIRPAGGCFVVHDLRSRNGTFVNERRAVRQDLREGDLIRVGETSLQLRTEHRRTSQ